MRLAEYVKNASKDAVIDGVKLLQRYHLSSNRIISSNNPLIKDGVKYIRKHANASPYQIQQSKINQFLAASSLSHLLDGWMYLSNSFNALLNGDEAAAVHLAYYAELRAAMSILSTEGIATFSNKHISAFSVTTNKVFSNAPTHQFVWNAMEKWSKSSTKPNDDILKIFKVQGVDFFELTEFFHPSTAGSTTQTIKIIKAWLKEWCFDIKNYRSDRENRNEVSYRPQRIKNFNQTLDFKLIINDLDKFWNVVSPTPNNQFDLLDKYLLRKLLTKLYTEISPNQPIEDLITNAFEQQGIYDENLINFMTFENLYANDHAIFNYANQKKPAALAIIARATLLLRISVGMVSQLYKAGGVTKTDLNFVWNNYSIDNGFWPPETPISNFNSLWLDIAPMLNELKNHLSSYPDTSIYSIREEMPLELIHVSQINRACLWGLDF